jgi:hypothetical protein
MFEPCYLSCSFPGPTFWKPSNLILSLVVGFFSRSLTRAWIYFSFSRCSFRYRVNTSPLMCEFKGKCLVINLFYHTNILFIINLLSYNIMYASWLATSFNYPPFTVSMSQPYFGQVWGWSPTLGKSEDLESSGTTECSEFDSKAQNTLHWGVLGFIGKVLKRKYRKWPHIGHLDICRPSYGQKKGRESDWQFDSRPLKIGNRPLPDLRIQSAIGRWKDLDEGYKFG